MVPDQEPLSPRLATGKSPAGIICVCLFGGEEVDVRGVPGQSRSNINLRNWLPRPRTTPEPAGRGDSPPGHVAVGHARCSDQSLPEQGAHRQMVSLRLDWMVGPPLHVQRILLCL